MKYIEITVDTNDGDYTTEVKKVEEDHLPTIRKVAQAISEYSGAYNYGEGDAADPLDLEYYNQKGITEKDFNLFKLYTPYSEFGFHTIEAIDLYEKINLESLL